MSHPINHERRQRMVRLYQQGASLTSLARDFRAGNETIVEQMLAESGASCLEELRPPTRAIPMHVPSSKLFCAQCDRAVFPGEADACASRFCKAKAA